MNGTLITLGELRRRVPRSRSTIYAEIGKRIFPKPIKVGRSSYWREDEIDRLVAAYSAGAGITALQELCASIDESRKSTPL